MKEIAAQFGCDPSNLTAKVDRLIALGLVERRPDPEVLGGLTAEEADTVQAAFDLLVNRTASA